MSVSHFLDKTASRNSLQENTRAFSHILNRGGYFFWLIPKSPRMSPSITANMRAGIYPLTANPLTRFPVSMTISPVIRNDMSPRVRKLRGAVRMRATPPITRFTIAKTIPTISAVQYPSTDTPGTIYDASITASPEMRNSMRSAIVRKLENNSYHSVFLS